MTGGQVLLQVLRHRPLVESDKDSTSLFHPEQEIGIKCSKRRGIGITNPNHVNRVTTFGVVPPNGSPKRAAKMLVQQIRQSHD